LTTLTPAALDAVLRGHGLPLHDYAPPRAVSARVLHLPSAAGGLAIKVFSAAEHAEATTEAALLTYLGQAPLAVAGAHRVQQRVRPLGDEALLSLGDRRVLVTRWEEGFHLAYHEIEATGWFVLGRVLAALHLDLDQAPPLPLRSLVAELRARDLDEDRRTLDEHRRRATDGPHPRVPLLRRMLDDRTALFDLHAHACQAAAPIADDRPIHNDYNVHNYLFHDDGAPTILDWERAVLAPRELEVCRCLAHLPLVAPASAWALVEGYLSLRALDPDLVPWAMQACALIHALKHWPVEPALAGAPGAAERIAGMAEIVRAFVEGCPRLEAFTAELCARIRRYPAHARVPHHRRP
jgi:aminoglycoside phosphotransferase (APT) family kinase protein